LSDEANEPLSGKPALSVCLDDSPALGGLSRGIRDLAEAVGGRILSLDSGRFPPSADDARWNLTRLDVGSGPLVSRHLRLPRKVAEKLDRAIAESGLVVCHSLYRAHLPFIRRRCLRHGVPYWVVIHGMLDPWVISRHAAWKRAWLNVYGIRCLADADRLIFNTEAEREKASPWCRRSNTHVIPWPVDVPDVSDQEECRAEIRRRLELASNDRILLWLGRYDSLKRPTHTIAAFAAAHTPGWHLVMAGYDGDLNRAAVAQAARQAGASHIHVLGPVVGEEKRQMLLAADAFVSLSWRENFGYALAEAAAAGLCYAVAPDHDLVAHMPKQCRQWVAEDHSFAEASRVLRSMLTTERMKLQDVGHVSRSWVNDHLTRKRFQRMIRGSAYSQAEEP
jgi:glycosyltransferase involved in cell wall biosynthesis